MIVFSVFILINIKSDRKLSYVSVCLRERCSFESLWERHSFFARARKARQELRLWLSKDNGLWSSNNLYTDSAKINRQDQYICMLCPGRFFGWIYKKVTEIFIFFEMYFFYGVISERECLLFRKKKTLGKKRLQLPKKSSCLSRKPKKSQENF